MKNCFSCEHVISQNIDGKKVKHLCNHPDRAHVTATRNMRCKFYSSTIETRKVQIENDILSFKSNPAKVDGAVLVAEAIILFSDILSEHFTTLITAVTDAKGKRI